MRITMSARPSVQVADGKLAIEAADTVTDDVEASAFTKVGVWFYILWKDAMKLNQKTSSTMTVVLAGQEIEITVEKAAVERDELTMEVGLSIAGS
jgi:hypothetical protein